MKITDLYRHDHFGNLVQVTESAGGWVEFLSNGSLFWLEEPVFLQAYTYYRDGDPIEANLAQLRALADQAGILIPPSIRTITIDTTL